MESRNSRLKRLVLNCQINGNYQRESFIGARYCVFYSEPSLRKEDVKCPYADDQSLVTERKGGATIDAHVEMQYMRCRNSDRRS